jgi:hypothetical protein
MKKIHLFLVGLLALWGALALFAAVVLPVGILLDHLPRDAVVLECALLAAIGLLNAVLATALAKRKVWGIYGAAVVYAFWALLVGFSMVKGGGSWPVQLVICLTNMGGAAFLLRKRKELLPG